MSPIGEVVKAREIDELKCLGDPVHSSHSKASIALVWWGKWKSRSLNTTVLVLRLWSELTDAIIKFRIKKSLFAYGEMIDKFTGVRFHYA